MKIRNIAALIICAGLTVPTLAQSEPSSELKAVLDALQSINDRLTALEQSQGPAPKGPVATAPASADSVAGAAATPTTSPPAGMVAQSGWLVSALPLVENNPEPDGLFVFPTGYRSAFSAHERHDNSNTWYRYLGQAKINIYEAGRHGFSVSIESPKSTRCWGYLSIDGKDVFWVGDINNSADVVGGSNGTFSGFTDLDVGNYDIKYRLSCTAYGYSPVYAYDQNDLKVWKSIYFEYKHKSPSDMAPRSFLPNELFYFARSEQPHAQSTALSAPEPGGISRHLEAGEEIVVVSAINVRSEPSTSASVVGQLEPGFAIALETPTAGTEWLQLGGDGVNGYVKITALLANSRLK